MSKIKESIVEKVGEFTPTKRFKDRTGFINGHLEVVALAGRNKWKQAIYLCKCNACGNDEFYVTAGDVTRNKSCGCGRWNVNKKSKHSHHQVGNRSPYWKGHGEISGYRFRKTQDRASKKGIEFNITIEQMWDLFLKQERKCSLSGKVLTFGAKAKDYGTASLDRIDSSKGYVMGNLQWVHKTINKMKTNLDQEEFLQMCELITEHRK